MLKINFDHTASRRPIPTFVAVLFLITMMMGCRKETDEFRRRPLSNGKVFIQIGGRKWMIDDSYPSFFNSENQGHIDPISKSYLRFDTINGRLCKVVGFTCTGESSKKENAYCNMLIKFIEAEDQKWKPIYINGYVSSNFTLSDSIFFCSKVLSGDINHISRINHTWHQGSVVFEGKPNVSTNIQPRLCIIKFILKS